MKTSLRIAIAQLLLCALLILARALQILVWVPRWLEIRTRAIAPPQAPTVSTTST